MSPKPGFRKCVLGLALVCGRLVQDADAHLLTTREGGEGLCEINTPLAPKKTGFRPYASRKLRVRLENQDSENVYLDSHLSVTDWGRMEVHIF